MQEVPESCTGFSFYPEGPSLPSEHLSAGCHVCLGESGLKLSFSEAETLDHSFPILSGTARILFNLYSSVSVYAEVRYDAIPILFFRFLGPVCIRAANVLVVKCILRFSAGLSFSALGDFFSFERRSRNGSFRYPDLVKLVNRFKGSFRSNRTGGWHKARHAQLRRAGPVSFSY
jgi:hypothetical protein